MKPKQIHGFISDRDIMFAVTSNIIGVLTLSFPRLIAEDTRVADGWLPILLGGGIACYLAWLLTKIASSYPYQNFYSIASNLLSKPIAIFIIVLFLLLFFIMTSYQIRLITVLAHQYLFDQTPMEVISLTFLLVIVYAVSGSRAAIFRLNIIFFPFLIAGVLLVILLPLGIIKLENLLPTFQTNLGGYFRATYSSISTFLGFGIVLFYMSIVKNPEKTPKLVVKGVMLPVILNIFLYVVCIGVFGNATTRNLFFPTFELSRTVEIPGGFFDRFDSVLFVVWTMIVFTTTLFLYDLLVMMIMMLWEQVKKINVVFTMSPLIFLASMLPLNYIELTFIGRTLNHLLFFQMITVTILIGIAYKMKGRKQN